MHLPIVQPTNDSVRVKFRPLRAELLEPAPIVSFVVTRRHDQQVLAQSLERIERCGLRREETEIIVVDQTHIAQTTEWMTRQFHLVDLMAEADNPRVRTLNAGFALARGRYIILLEDDSHPRPGSILRMIMHFDAHPDLAAVVFTVTQADGERVHAPYPNVILRYGTGIRRKALEQVAIPENLLDASAEYDLSLRILSAGYSIRAFDDVHATWEHVDRFLAGAQTLGQEVQDNVLALTRLFPTRWVVPYARDWMKRSRYLAASTGQNRSYYKGLLKGLARAMNPRHRCSVNPEAFESLVKVGEIEKRLREARDAHTLRSIIFLDFSPNLLAFWLAAKACDIRVVGVADGVIAGSGRTYRGVPVVTDEVAGGWSLMRRLQRRCASKKRPSANAPGGGLMLGR